MWEIIILYVGMQVILKDVIPCYKLFNSNSITYSDLSFECQRKEIFKKTNYSADQKLTNSNTHVFNEIPDENTEGIYILKNNDALQIQSAKPISFSGFFIPRF